MIYVKHTGLPLETLGKILSPYKETKFMYIKHLIFIHGYYLIGV